MTVGAEQQGMVAGDAVNTASRVQSAGRTRAGVGRRDDPAADLVGDHLRRRRQPPAEGQGRADAAVGGPRGRRGRAAAPSVPTVSRRRSSAATASCGWSRSSSTASRRRGRPALLVVDGEAGVGQVAAGAGSSRSTSTGSTDTGALAQRPLPGLRRGCRLLRAGRGGPRGRLRPTGRTTTPTGAGRRRSSLERGPGGVRAGPGRSGRGCGRASAPCSARRGRQLPREDLFAAWTTFFERVGGGTEPVVDGDRRRAARRRRAAAVRRAPAGRGDRSRCFVVLLTRPGLLERASRAGDEPARHGAPPADAVDDRHGRPARRAGVRTARRGARPRWCSAPRACRCSRSRRCAP